MRWLVKVEIITWRFDQRIGAHLPHYKVAFVRRYPWRWLARVMAFTYCTPVSYASVHDCADRSNVIPLR